MTAEQAPDPGGRERGIYTIWAFISSSLSELAAERQALDRGLTAVAPHFYDHEHGAALESHQQEWRHDLTRCDVYIGIYWKKLGPWTRDEFEEARKQRKPMLLYFKGPFEWEGREQELRDFIASLGDVDRQGAAFFEDEPAAFAALVNADLEREKLKALAESIERRRQVHAPDTGLTYTPTPDGGRLDEAAGPPPAASRRAAVSTLEPFDGEFLDREEVLEELLDALEEDAGEELIELVGPKGMGKGSVLERLVTEDLDDYPDGLGVNPVGASLDDVDDLLRTVFEAFYESSDPEVVTAWSAETLRAHLAGTHDGTEQVRALVVFEDVPAESEQFAELRAALPKSLAVCITTEGETGEGLDVPVEGFEDAADVLALFEQRYKAPVPEKAEEFVLAACALLGNAPGAIRELGRLAGREAKPVPGLEPLVAWARAKAESPASRVLERGGAAKDAVKALIAAGGEAPAAVVGAVAGAAGAGAALADDLIEPGSPRYRLGSVVTHDVADAADDATLMGAILDSAVVWAEQARLDEIRDDRAFVMRMVAWGLLQGRYEEVLRLAEAAEPALAMGLRWSAWERVLEGALAASRALNRPCSEAWARHQLGTRALLLGDLAGARRELSEALELRLAYCPPVAADLSRHNLALAEAKAARGPVLVPGGPVLVPGGPVRVPGGPVRSPGGLLPARRRRVAAVRGPTPGLRRVVPGIIAAIAILLLVGLAGPRGGIDDFDVAFGTVEISPDSEELTLFRLGPEEYSNDRAVPSQIFITLVGDPEFCLAVAGVGAAEGECVEPVAADEAAPRAPPVGRLVPGMPLAQAGGGCELTAAPGEFVLTIGPGGSCPVLFGFAPPAIADVDLAARATFETARGGRWRGRLSGSTQEGDPVIELAKRVDADGDGAFAQVERHPAPAGDATFEVTITNVRPGSAVTLLELVDNRYGDIATLEGTDCQVGTVIAPGGAYTCRYSGPVAPIGGDTYANVVTATVDLADVAHSAAATATVTFADPDAAIRVTKQVDADGDGAFAGSEPFPGTVAGPVEYEVSVENRNGADVTITALRDDVFGDLGALAVTSCGTGVVVPAGGMYECRFTAELDPGDGTPHRNTVEVTVDPPLDGPYTAQAVVTFPATVQVTKTVDADDDGEFRVAESPAGEGASGVFPFRVEVRNTGVFPVEVVAMEDSAFGDVTTLPGSTCAAGATIAAGDALACEFRAAADVTTTQHENVVTVTLDTPSGRLDVDSNRAIVFPVEDTEVPRLLVDADGDGSFAPGESAPEGALRPVTYQVRIPQPPGRGSRPVVVAPFGDVSGRVDCTSDASVESCTFTAEVGGDAGESVVAELDVAALTGAAAPPATATVTFADANPSLGVTTSGPVTASRGDRVTITVTVRNDSVDTDPVTLTFPAACGAPTIAAGDSVTCRLDVAITGAAGTTQRIPVTVRGTDDEGNTAEASDAHAVAVRRAGLEVDKALESHADADGSGSVTPGDTLTYRYTVLNVGDDPLASLALSDSRIGAVGGCAASLPAGGLTSCTASYVVTAGDAAAGQVVNEATATATAPSGPVRGSDTVAVAVATPPPPPPPELVVEVRTVPHSGVAFTFGGAFAGTLRPGEQAVRQVTPGTHQVTLAAVPDLWRLDAVACDPGGTGDVVDGRATYQLTSGARVRCVFSFAGTAPIVDIDREIVWFSPVAVNGASGAEVVTVRNVGTAAVPLADRVVWDTTTQNGVAVPLGSPSPHFTVSDTCPGTLAAGSSCTFAIEFRPTAPGTHVGIVQVDPGGPGDTDVVVIGFGS